MDKKIKEFYAKKNLHVNRMVEKRPADIKPAQVYVAAEKLYQRIQNGLDIKDIKIVWKIWEMARDCATTEYDEKRKRLAELKTAVKRQRSMIKLLQADKENNKQIKLELVKASLKYKSRYKRVLTGSTILAILSLINAGYVCLTLIEF